MATPNPSPKPKGGKEATASFNEAKPPDSSPSKTTSSESEDETVKKERSKSPVPAVQVETREKGSNLTIGESASRPLAAAGKSSPKVDERIDTSTGLRVRNASKHLEALRELEEGDTIVLLTPAVPPLDDIDPYQCFGEAIAKHRPKTAETAHIPYTNDNRITSVHRGHIKRAKAVIVVANDTKVGEAAPHIDAVHQVNVIVNDTRPLVVVLTNKSPELWDTFDQDGLATVIQIPDYTKESLEMAASVMFGEI